ncbi:COQ9 family protein [uncultured Litoreibacter sp.]|uniref:COQ9 family protein n=1 Tax=uncultured Litoreibacter sp. TaxID=1392394 RepID=UPI00262157A5|nr:COQ9 family protein [uncultured Litoreibacter sp.]
MEDAKTKLLDASLPHVTFDGWSQDTFDAAIEDSGVDRAAALALYPRGALDLAVAFHKRGDAQMVARLQSENLLSLRFRDRIAAGVRFRLEAAGLDKEAVRRGTSFFAVPVNAPEGAKLVWGTADAIWTALGDQSVDHNWYTKRATLSAVYGATVLFWLGDDSENYAATWEFLDRRIDNVMQFEKVKAQVNAHPLASKLMTGPNWLLSQLKAPGSGFDSDLPGHMNSK